MHPHEAHVARGAAGLGAAIGVKTPFAAPGRRFGADADDGEAIET